MVVLSGAQTSGTAQILKPNVEYSRLITLECPHVLKKCWFVEDKRSLSKGC